MKRNIFTLVLLLTTLTFSAFSQSSAEIKQRMADRLPMIDQMKLEQLIGENNQAYLTVLKTTTEKQADLVQKENLDRKTIYTMLARQIGTTIKVVQSRRASQIRDIAAPGTMIQTPDGDWITKK